MNHSKLFVAAVAAFVSVVAIADEAVDELARRQARRYEKTGGKLVSPKSFKGKVAFIDAQDILPAADIRTAMRIILDGDEYNFVYEKAVAPRGCASSLKSQSKADLALILIADKDKPASLIAPDDRWAMVNVAKMDVNLMTPAAKERFFAGRCRREILKIFSLLAGGGASNYPGNVTCQHALPDLDRVDEFLPADVKGHIRDCFSALGITPKAYVTYRTACKEGWAPAPTNDVQKAIWDKIHAPPSKPLKITYDNDRQKPVVK